MPKNVLSKTRDILLGSSFFHRESLKIVVSQVCSRVRLVAEIGVVLESQGKFSISEISGGHDAVI